MWLTVFLFLNAKMRNGIVDLLEMSNVNHCKSNNWTKKAKRAVEIMMGDRLQQKSVVESRLLF